MVSVGEELRCKKCGQYKPDRCTCNTWQSKAYWPRGTGVSLGNSENASTDTHPTKAHAQAVADTLRSEGFGGEGKIYPLKIEVTCLESGE